MKTQTKQNNEKKNEVEKADVVEKPKRIRRERKFLLYVEGQGLIRIDNEGGAMPNFTTGHIITYTSRSAALFAREFFLSIKLAESIDIVAKVA